MKKNLDFSHFFITPDAWNSVIPIDQKNPISEFNKLNMETQFDKSLQISSLNQFFEELIFYIKSENIHYVNNLVFGFIPILLSIKDDFGNIIINTPFFQISKIMFNNIYKKNQKYPSLLIAVSLFDILSSNLPILISYGHLFHIQEEQADLIHRYLYDGNTNSLPTKCLAASLAFPSSRFNESNSNYPKYKELLYSVNQARAQCLPDPKVMLEKSDFFSQSEIIYASFVVQYCNSLIFSIGFDQYLSHYDHPEIKHQSPTSLTLERCHIFQDLIIISDLTLGSLCHSILIHSSQPSTFCVLRHFFNALDCSIGIELLKELFILNTTTSFRDLVSKLGVTSLHNIFKQAETETVSPNASFMNLVLPFHENVENLHLVISSLVEMTRADEDRRKILPFLGSLHSVLVRFATDKISSTYKVLIEHFVGVSFVVHSFFEMLTLQPQFERFEVTHLSVCIIELLYKNVERFGIKSLSSKFLHGTFECVTYLMHVPIESVTFLLFEVANAQSEFKKFVQSHEAVLTSYMKAMMPDLLLPAAAVALASFRSPNLADPSVLLRVVNYACVSYMPRVFYAAKCAVSNFCDGADDEVVIGTFLKRFYDLYFAYVSTTLLHKSETDGFVFNPDKMVENRKEPEDIAHAATLYLLLMAEVLKSSGYAVKKFIAHPAFPSLYEDAQSQFNSMLPPYTTLLCPLVEIVEALWGGDGSLFEEAGVKIEKGGEEKEKRKSESEKESKNKRPSEIKDEKGNYIPQVIIVVDDDDDLDDGSEKVEGGLDMSSEKVGKYTVRIPLISNLLSNIQFLWAPTASSLLSLALSVSKCLGSCPYPIQPHLIAQSPAENAFGFLAEISGLVSEDIPPLAEKNKLKKIVESETRLGPTDCGIPWCCPYEYEFIILQKPLVIVQKNIQLPNSQIIEEDENEEEEEEEDKESDSSEF